ncbi:MAG: hypothetical protein WCP98_03770 [Actinomycetes bacterium]
MLIVNDVADGRDVTGDCLGRDWNASMRGFLTTAELTRWRAHSSATTSPRLSRL